MNELRLSVELVPSTSWGSNVRAVLTKQQWAVLSKSVRSKAYDICNACGGEATDCHEVWAYDDQKQSQKLTGMVALCHACHEVKHIGLAGIRGHGERAIKHFMRVNELSRRQAEKVIQRAFDVWAERSEVEWTLDISILSDYGVDMSKIKEPIEL